MVVTIVSIVISVIGAIASIFGVIAFFQNRGEGKRKEQEERELDQFYVRIVNTLSSGTSNAIIFELGSTEFFLAEKLVRRNQLSRSGFKGIFTLNYGSLCQRAM